MGNAVSNRTYLGNVGKVVCEDLCRLDLLCTAYEIWGCDSDPTCPLGACYTGRSTGNPADAEDVSQNSTCSGVETYWKVQTSWDAYGAGGYTSQMLGKKKQQRMKRPLSKRSWMRDIPKKS